MLHTRHYHSLSVLFKFFLNNLINLISWLQEESHQTRCQIIKNVVKMPVVLENVFSYLHLFHHTLAKIILQTRGWEIQMTRLQWQGRNQPQKMSHHISPVLLLCLSFLPLKQIIIIVLANCFFLFTSTFFATFALSKWLHLSHPANPMQSLLITLSVININSLV